VRVATSTSARPSEALDGQRCSGTSRTTARMRDRHRAKTEVAARRAAGSRPSDEHLTSHQSRARQHKQAFVPAFTQRLIVMRCDETKCCGPLLAQPGMGRQTRAGFCKSVARSRSPRRLAKVFGPECQPVFANHLARLDSVMNTPGARNTPVADARGRAPSGPFMTGQPLVHLASRILAK
jgi:hypothetical protein